MFSLQVVDPDPVFDLFPQSTTASAPPSETTSGDVSPTKDEDEDMEDNSVEQWDATTPGYIEEDILIAQSDNEILHSAGKGSRRLEVGSPKGVTSENLWERTEVLAGEPGVSLLHVLFLF